MATGNWSRTVPIPPADTTAVAGKAVAGKAIIGASYVGWTSKEKLSG